ncbi:MAG: neutral/alkaline non-lysosomal ceramidase N-terminal domain-containing protein [Thermoproteota archaeon]
MHEFTVGFGKVEITPPLTIPYLGFCPNRHALFKGVHDPLYARSLYVSSGGEEAVVISADAFGFSNSILGEARNFTWEVREKISRRTGIPSANIMLASSHIHSTPDTLNFRPLVSEVPCASEWLEKLQEQIALSAETAWRKRFKASLKIGKGRVENISLNRRGGDFLDEEIIVLVFESSEREKIFLVNFACHPVIVQVQDLISADYVGVVETTVENTVKNTKGCLFIQGACGDINPVCGTTNFNDAYLTGLSIAGEVMRIYGGISLSKSNYPVEPTVLKTGLIEASFPSRPLPPQEDIEKLLKDIEGEKRRMEHAESEEERIEILRRICMIEEILTRVKEGDGHFLGELQLIRMGNALLFGIPGEPFSELGMEVKKMSRPFTGIPAGYANGYLGYIAPPSAWEKGGYEVSLGPWSKVGPEAFNIIIEAFKKVKEAVQ